MRAIWICHQIQTRLWEFVAGKLASRDARRVQAHLDHCVVCRAVWERVRATVPRIVSLREQPTPGSETDFADVVRRIEVSQDHRMRPGARPRYLHAALAGVLVALYVVTTRQAGPHAVAIVSTRHPAAGNHSEFGVQAKETIPLGPGTAAAGPPMANLRRREMARGASGLVRPLSSLGGMKPIRTAGMPRPGPMRFASPRLVGVSDHYGSVGPLRLSNRRPPHIARGMPGRNEGTEMARQQSDLLMVSADRPVEMDGVVARLREPVRAFVMPAMGQDEAPGRSFIMQTIPNTTFAGQTGTAAAAARNTEAGRAL